jgi:threonine synthase
MRVGENVTGLVCRECGRTYPLEPLSICEVCFGPLEVSYDLGSLAGRISRGDIERGPSTLWRYRPLLPAPEEPPIDLGAGFTPMRRAERLGKALGVGELWLKDDTGNPTGSFKDRVVSVATTVSRSFGFDTVACASTGNLANATAGHAAAAGLKAYIFVPHDLERAKIVATGAFGATVVAVKGNYDDVNRLCSEVAEALPWAFVNVNVRPFYAEGSKTLGFETAEQLDWGLPDHVVVPIASGALLTKINQGFRQLVAVGLVEDRPVRISGAQATGCAPVARAFKEGTDQVRPVRPETIAKSLAIGNPADGYYAVRVARETGGSIEDASDEEIVAGVRMLAETEGLFAETAGGVTVACLRKLAEAGVIRSDERVVAYITGTGFKTVEALEEALPPSLTVSPSLEEFREAAGV